MLKYAIFFLLPWISFLTDLTAQPTKDWLLDGSSYQAEVQEDKNKNQLHLSNGLIRRSFLLTPNAATIAFDNLMTGEAILRGVKPEAEITIDSVLYEVGGLKGQPNYAFLRPEDIPLLQADPEALSFSGYEIGEPQAPFAWKQVRHHAPGASWPPNGKSLRLDFENGMVKVFVHYELYDGTPVMAKWLTVENQSDQAITIDDFSSEILAAVEYGSAVETRHYNVPRPNIHVETDYAFASFNVEDANHHAVHWESDPDYESQVNYLRQTPCLLKVSPEIGPGQKLEPGESFQSFRTFVLPHDSYDRERQGLALRRMYRTIAPWTTENPLMMHARFADWERVKTAIDQAAEVGFEMVILTFGSGFNIEDDSEEYLQKMKGYADYAKSKGVEIGGYSLLASRKIGGGQDVVMSGWGETNFWQLSLYWQ